MTKTEAEALLAQASPDGWSDVRTWQSPAGTWAAWIAAGSTATEPTRAHIDTCGVEGHATEGDAGRFAWCAAELASVARRAQRMARPAALNGCQRQHTGKGRGA